MNRPLLGLGMAMIVALSTGRSEAALIFFIDDEAGFNTVVAGLSFAGTEDWESSTLGPGMITVVSDPIAPGVANGPFLTGTNASTGLTVQSNTLGGAPVNPSPGGDLATASAGLSGTPTDQVSTNGVGHSFDMLFGLSDTQAASFNPLLFDSDVSGDPGTATIRVYDSSNNLLDTAVDINVAGFMDPTTFVGVVATGGDDIGRINVFATSPGDDFTGADNIDVFTQSVPEPVSLALMGIAACGLCGVRRRSRHRGRQA